MSRYLFRRLLQTIPTVLGVILINFILFNIVGESPGLMVLGNKATAESLEEFDEVRGYNKPLLFGRRAPTRAYQTVDFTEGIGPWINHTNAAHQTDLLRLGPGAPIHPLAFDLKPDLRYEWTITYRLESGSEVHFFGLPLHQAGAGGKHEEHEGHEANSDQQLTSCSSCLRVNSSSESVASSRLRGQTSWQTHRFEVSSADAPTLEVIKGGIEIRSLELKRLVDHPFDSQLVFYLRQLLRGDLGHSEFYNQSVASLLKGGVGPSLSLTIPIFFIGLIVSIIMALLCAFFRDTWVDRFFVILSVALMSINYLVYIVAGQYGLAYKLGAFPVWGYESARYLVLPVLIGVVSGLGANIRFYRTVMLDEMYKDYVRTAFAKGVSKPRVLFVHVLKNALIPIITNVSIAIPFLYTGSLLLETFFGIPGLGHLGINAILSSDVDLVRALVLIGALLFVVTNLITDLCYALADPRIKLQ